MYVEYPFRYPSPSGGRFTPPGSTGLYVAREYPTALHEVLFHWARVFRAQAEPPRTLTLQVLHLALEGLIADLRGGRAQWPECYDADPATYARSQGWGTQVRGAGIPGIAYDSVRHRRGTCALALAPHLVTACRLGERLMLYWDGTEFAGTITPFAS